MLAGIAHLGFLLFALLVCTVTVFVFAIFNVQSVTIKSVGDFVNLVSIV